MENIIVKTTTFRDHPGCKCFLEEMQEGQKHVRKSYADHAKTDEEWDALCYLYNAGFNVPKPYKKDTQGMYMQYIDGGILWDKYQTVDAATQQDLIRKFTKLLHDFHNVTPKKTPPFDGFVQNELVKIKTIMVKKGIGRHWDVHSKLRTLSASIEEQPLCYVHRDYHVWNVLIDSSQKLYLIDMELELGDYRFDVGWTYMLQSRSAVHDARHNDIAQAFLSEYFRIRPEARKDIEFFMQLANLRWLVNVEPENKTDEHWFPEMKAIAEKIMHTF